MLRVMHDDYESGSRVHDSDVVVPFPLAEASARERADENTLLLAVKATADRVAFTTLFTRLAPRIQSYLRRSGLLAGDAENIQQDVWLGVWRHATRFDPELASARTWIFTLIRNRAADYARERQRDLRLADALSEPTKRVATDPAEEVHGQRIVQLLAELPPEQREIVWACYVEGKAQSQLARELELPIGTVKSRARLAFARLKLLLGESP